MSQSILVGSNREKRINPIKVLKFNKYKLYTFLKAVPPFCWLKKLLRRDKINNKLAQATLALATLTVYLHKQK